MEDPESLKKGHLDSDPGTSPESAPTTLIPLRGAYRKLHAGWSSLRHQATRMLDPSVRTMSQRLARLKGQYLGQRCFVMGNGPSLNQMDLELFKEEYIWASNKVYLLFDRITWIPSFYLAVDTVVVPDIATEINHLTAQLPETRFFFPVLFREKRVLKSHPQVYWYPEKKLDENDLPHGMFSLEASSRVASVRTVSIAAMQLAVYLGFNPIYLIGCDTSYSLPSTTRMVAGTKTTLESTQDDDPNHFDPNYFGKGAKWRLPQVDRMIFHYKQAKLVCDEIGVQVFNATVGGALEVFPRVDYRNLFD